MAGCGDLPSETDPTPERLHVAIDEAIDLFRRSFADVRAAQESDEVWEGIATSLGSFRAGPWLREWYVAHQLSACRRVMDRGADTSSFVRALRVLCPIADHLTVEVLEEHHGPVSEDDRYDGLMALNVTELRERAGKHQVTEGEATARSSWPTDVPAIGRDTVEADLRLIDELGADIRQLATRMTAHRIDGKKHPAVSASDVRALVRELAAIYQRWMLVLDAVSVSTRTEHFTTSAAKQLRRPLDLFDEHAWLRAKMEARKRLAIRGAPSDAYEHLDDMIVARYELRPDDASDDPAN